MRTLVPVILLLLAPAAWAQPKLPPPPPPPPLPPGFGGEATTTSSAPATPGAPAPSGTVDLTNYIQALRTYAKSAITNPQSAKSNEACAQLARTELSTSPYVRDISVGIFQELDRYAAAKHEASEDIGLKKPKGSLNTLAQHPEKIVQPLIDAGKAQEKAGDEAGERQQAVEKSIAGRLESLEKQVPTPVGQQFALSSNSKLYRALTQPAAFAKELDNNLGAVPK